MDEENYDFEGMDDEMEKNNDDEKSHKYEGFTELDFFQMSVESLKEISEISPVIQSSELRVAMESILRTVMKKYRDK